MYHHFQQLKAALQFIEESGGGHLVTQPYALDWATCKFIHGYVVFVPLRAKASLR